MPACLVAGIILRRKGRCPENTPEALNGFIIHISLPALALYHIHSIVLTRELIYTGLMAWVFFSLGVLFFYYAGKKFNLPRTTIGALMLLGGIGNTSFVGLPMIRVYYGSQWIGVGIVADLVGSFFVLSTLGIVVANMSTSGKVSLHHITNRILTFPPFLALVTAFLLKPVIFPEWFNFILSELGDTLTPLALVSVGFQLQLGDLEKERISLTLGLVYKLLLGPALVALIYTGLLGARGMSMQVTLFEAAMGPMISAGIVAADYKLNPPLVSLMLGIGIPLSFLTLPVWHFLFSRI